MSRNRCRVGIFWFGGTRSTAAAFLFSIFGMLKLPKAAVSASPAEKLNVHFARRFGWRRSLHSFAETSRFSRRRGRLCYFNRPHLSRLHRQTKQKSDSGLSVPRFGFYGLPHAHAHTHTDGPGHQSAFAVAQAVPKRFCSRLTKKTVPKEQLALESRKTQNNPLYNEFWENLKPLRKGCMKLLSEAVPKTDRTLSVWPSFRNVHLPFTFRPNSSGWSLPLLDPATMGLGIITTAALLGRFHHRSPGWCFNHQALHGRTRIDLLKTSILSCRGTIYAETFHRWAANRNGRRGDSAYVWGTGTCCYVNREFNWLIGCEDCWS